MRNTPFSLLVSLLPFVAPQSLLQKRLEGPTPTGALDSQGCGLAVLK